MWKPNPDAEEDYLMWTIEEFDKAPDFLEGETLEEYNLRVTQEEYKNYKLLPTRKEFVDETAPEIKAKQFPQINLIKKGAKKAFDDGKITEEKYLELIKDL